MAHQAVNALRLYGIPYANIIEFLTAFTELWRFSLHYEYLEDLERFNAVAAKPFCIAVIESVMSNRIIPGILQVVALRQS